MNFDDLKTPLFGHEDYSCSLPPTMTRIANQLGVQLKPNVGYSGGLLFYSKDPFLTTGLVVAACVSAPTDDSKAHIRNIKYLAALEPELAVLQEIDELKSMLIKSQLNHLYYEKLVPNLRTLNKGKLTSVGNIIYQSLKDNV